MAVLIVILGACESPRTALRSDTRAHAVAAQRELTCAEKSGGKDTCLTNAAPLDDSSRMVESSSKMSEQDIREAKQRYANLDQWLTNAEDQETALTPPGWVLFPIGHAAASATRGHVSCGSDSPDDIYGTSYTLGLVTFGVLPIISSLMNLGNSSVCAAASWGFLDLAMFPIALLYDMGHSSAYHLHHAWLAHNVHRREKQLEAFRPKYLAALAAQKVHDDDTERAGLAAEQKRYQNGQILWVGMAGKAGELFPSIKPPDRIDENHLSPMDNLASMASQLLRQRFQDYIGTKPTPPAPAPTITRGEYESKASFARRVEDARHGYNVEVQEYNKAVRAYRRRIRSYQLSKAARTRIYQIALFAAFGKPVVKKTIYDPDSQTFRVLIVSNSPYSDGFKQAFVLSKKIPNEEASGFDRLLKESAGSWRILFQREGSALKVVSASLEMDGKYFARPVAGLAGEPTLASVSLKNLDKLSLPPPIPMMKPIKLHYETGAGSDVDKPKLPEIPRHPDDFAVVVGIEDYRDKNIPQAEFAVRDAATVASYFRALGVPKDHVILLTNQEATAGAIKGYLDSWLPRNVQPDSKVYFYFSGHGAPDAANKTAYLLPWDGNPGFLRDTAQSVADMYQALGKLKTKNILVALDSCFSGSGGRSVIERGIRPLVTQIRTGYIPKNVTALMAARGSQIAQSMEAQGHGMFTYYFLKGLDDGKRNAHALCRFLKPAVEKAAALKNQDQDPVCHGPDFRFW